MPERPLRVAVLARAVYPYHGVGGLERHVADLVLHLEEAGVRVTLIAPPPRLPTKAPMPASTFAPVPYRTFPFAGRRGTTILDRDTAYLLFGWRAGRLALRLARAGAVDVVHGLGASVLGYAYARARGSAPVPLLLNPQGLEEFGATDPQRAGLKRFAYWPLQRAVALAARGADRIVATDRSLVGVVERYLGGGADRIVVVPNAVDLGGCDRSAAAAGMALLRERHRIAPEDRVLLSVGRIEENKGFHVLAAALGRLRARESAENAVGWRWVLVGAGPFSTRLERDIEAAGIASRMIWAGRVPDEELHAWYEMATVFVHPTLYEGSSLVTLEAMAHGKAIVATRAGGLPDKVSPGRNGWLVPPGDDEALAAALAEALDPAAPLRAMGLESRRRVEAEFAWPSVTRRLVSVYEELVGVSKGHPRSG